MKVHMGVNMDQENFHNCGSVLQIKELKEKLRSLVSEVDLNRENYKLKPERSFSNCSSDSVISDEINDEFFDCSEAELWNETSWLTKDENHEESVEEICKRVYFDIDDHIPDISNLCQLLESSTQQSNVFTNRKASIDSRTFTRPKKFNSRPSLPTSEIEGRPKLERRLTTTISPTPTLITKLEELSKSNNRPVSGIYENSNWEDGSEETLAEIATPTHRNNCLPSSLFNRLQELKKANSSFKLPVEPSSLSENIEGQTNEFMLEDAKKVMAALDFDNKNSHSFSVSEIFKNTQDCFSDDNESFINLDEVSGFCDRLTLSTDQSTYSSIVREMEQHEICLFHRTLDENQSKDQSISRLTFGGVEIPKAGLLQNQFSNSVSKENCPKLNRTYELEKDSNTIENSKNTHKHNIMNSTYDANKSPHLLSNPDMPSVQQSATKDITPSKGLRRSMENLKNYDNNKELISEENNLLNYTYDKTNRTMNQNELNERYSTKVFDSNYRKSEHREYDRVKSPPRIENYKKDNEFYVEGRISPTSENIRSSINYNAEAKSAKNDVPRSSKKFSSTPSADEKLNPDFDSLSPIKMEVGDGESRAYSNPSSRGHSPRRMSATVERDISQKQRISDIRHSLKAPQRQLKLKPVLMRPSQNFKRPLSTARTSSEPSVPHKVDTCQPASSMPALRTTGPINVPSSNNVKSANKISGIPRPPTRLKPPQIRVNYSKK